MPDLPADAITAARDALILFIGDPDWLHIAAVAVAEAAAPALRAQGAAAERERCLAVLAEHYLMTVICNEETHQDNPVCGCSRVFLGWHPSIGAARQAYIDHVADLLDGADDE